MWGRLVVGLADQPGGTGHFSMEQSMPEMGEGDVSKVISFL